MSRLRLTAALSMVIACSGCGSSAADRTEPSGPAVAPSPTTGGASAVTSTRVPATSGPTASTSAFLPDLPIAGLGASRVAKLQGVLNRLVAAGAPDAIGAVITADGVWAGAAGVDGPNGRTATPGDEFNIASVSKPMLAALILRLAEDGKLDLDAPLSNYLGDLDVDANGASVRQALHMRAGFGDTPGSSADEAAAHCERIWTREDALTSIPAPQGAPGGIFQYSNPTYKLLGYAAERITGVTLEAAFDERLFAPLGLDRILLQGASRATPKPWALPVGIHGGALSLDQYGTGGTLPCVSLSSFSFATSAVASDAPSLARWAWGLFSGELIDLEHLSNMTIPFDGVHAMGFEVLPNFAPIVALGVHGGQLGYSAFLVVIPEQQVIAVLFINDRDADVESGARELIAAAFD